MREKNSRNQIFSTAKKNNNDKTLEIFVQNNQSGTKHAAPVGTRVSYQCHGCLQNCGKLLNSNCEKKYKTLEIFVQNNQIGTKHIIFFLQN